jgi:hypothetical protein
LHGLKVFLLTALFAAFLFFAAAMMKDLGLATFIATAFLLGVLFLSFFLLPIALMAGVVTISFFTAICHALVPALLKGGNSTSLKIACIAISALTILVAVFPGKIDGLPVMQPVNRETQCYKVDEPRTFEFHDGGNTVIKLTMPSSYMRPQLPTYIKKVSFLKKTQEPYCNYTKSNSIERRDYHKQVQDFELRRSNSNLDDPIYMLAYWKEHPHSLCPWTQMRSDIPGTILFKRVSTEKCLPSVAPKTEEYLLPQEENPKVIYDIHCIHGRHPDESQLANATCELNFRYKDILLVTAKILPQDIPRYSEMITSISRLMDRFPLEVNALPKKE